MKKDHWTAGLLAVTVTLLVSLAGCTAGNAPSAVLTSTEAPASEPSATETAPVTILMMQQYAFDGAELEKVVSAVNGLLDRNGVKIKMNVMTIGNDQFLQSVASGQRYDIAPVYGSTLLRDYVASGLLANLNDETPYFDGLYQVTPEAAWQSVTIDGKLYAIPIITNSSMDGVIESGILIRKDVLKALNADAPKTPQELLALALAAKEKGLDYQIAYNIQTPPYALHRTYSQWPFYVDETSMFLYGKDDSITTYAESNIYRQDKSILSSYNKAGVLRGFQSQADAEPFMDVFDCIASFYPIGSTSRAPHASDMQLIQFNPEKEHFPMSALSSFYVGVSSRSASIPNALTVLESIYTIPEVYDTFMYGRKGTDWAEHGDGTITILAKSCNAFTFDNLLMARKRQNSISSLPTDDKTLIRYPATAFQFYAKTQEQKKLQDSVYQSQDGYSGTNGIIGLRVDDQAESATLAAVQRMKDAGLDALLREYQQQYNAYLAGLQKR